MALAMMTNRLIPFGLVSAILIATIVPAGAANQRPEGLETHALVNEAHTLLHQSQASKASEKQLEQIVLILADRAATPLARELLEALSTREPQVFVRHEEGPAMLPFVDVGAAARYALRQWQRAAGRADALRTTRAADAGFISEYLAATPARQAGMVDAIRASQSKDLLVYRDELARRIIEPEADKLAAAFVQILMDAELCQQLITTGTPPVALAILREVNSLFGADTGLNILHMAFDRPAIASAALFEIGALIATLPAAEHLLWDTLADRTLGGSAAAVLARHADSATVNQLLGILRGTDDELLQKRALLALRLSEDQRGLQLANEWLAERHNTGSR